MKRVIISLGLILVLIAVFAVTDYVSANPSDGFREKNGDVFDDWEIARTRAFGEDGFYQITEKTFRPVIVFESLGENAALAYRLGEQIAMQYPDRMQRAEAVFSYVRDRVNYATDIDQFNHKEFAQNADELAIAIDKNGAGYGDCEDSAVLLAVMYKGAGYRSAIVAGEGHTAAIVYLPGYKKAQAVFEVEGEPGWIWAEATGSNNPLGWAPKEFINVQMAAYEISEEAIAPAEPSRAPSVVVSEGGGKGGSSMTIPFGGVFFLLWLIPLFRRKRR